eukprot:CAMPEP_0113845784 /NCGR_PEP_ID=MMETSP0372-20130328/949_1 /TAXON_ID=340204 /ORGANISM="Lankesteria abbotti" /LENGTH=455 /DNA_ID=CAMNT_0000814865 /DNA_START=54 /DNA_END=1421 /DNA_ORIENTATION=+ /assembly_acc=CAM_ASM_000359
MTEQMTKVDERCSRPTSEGQTATHTRHNAKDDMNVTKDDINATKILTKNDVNVTKNDVNVTKNDVNVSKHDVYCDGAARTRVRFDNLSIDNTFVVPEGQHQLTWTSAKSKDLPSENRRRLHSLKKMFVKDKNDNTDEHKHDNTDEYKNENTDGYKHENTGGYKHENTGGYKETDISTNSGSHDTPFSQSPSISRDPTNLKYRNPLSNGGTNFDYSPKKEVTNFDYSPKKEATNSDYSPKKEATNFGYPPERVANTRVYEGEWMKFYSDGTPPSSSDCLPYLYSASTSTGGQTGSRTGSEISNSHRSGTNTGGITGGITGGNTGGGSGSGSELANSRGSGSDEMSRSGTAAAAKDGRRKANMKLTNESRSVTAAAAKDGRRKANMKLDCTINDFQLLYEDPPTDPCERAGWLAERRKLEHARKQGWRLNGKKAPVEMVPVPNVERSFGKPWKHVVE